MRNKRFAPQEAHKEVKRSRFLKSIDKKTTYQFISVARTELLKAKARDLVRILPTENGFSRIPNKFLDELMKENLSVDQFNEILSIFRRGNEQ